MANSSSDNSIVAQKWFDVYKEVCANIRATDEISFKLLGLVPTFAGAGAGVLTLLDKSGTASSLHAMLSLALVGFIATVGLFSWELRNIQKCKRLIERAKELEQFALANSNPPQALQSLQYLGWDEEKKQKLQVKRLWKWGKTESEVVVYCAALVAWLIPVGLAICSLVTRAKGP